MPQLRAGVSQAATLRPMASRAGVRAIPTSDLCPPRPLSPTVVTATLAETGLVSLGILLLLASRLLFVAISVYYYYQVGRKPKKV